MAKWVNELKVKVREEGIGNNKKGGWFYEILWFLWVYK